MRRHPVLIPISREHRRILLLAQLLKKNAPPYKGLPTDLDGKQVYATQLYDELIKAHMAREDRLFNVIRGLDEHTDLLINELESEHEAMNILFEKAAEGKLHVEQADELGFMLEKHVRKEERQLFERVQKFFTEEQMRKLEKILYSSF